MDYVQEIASWNWNYDGRTAHTAYCRWLFAPYSVQYVYFYSTPQLISLRLSCKLNTWVFISCQ